MPQAGSVAVVEGLLFVHPILANIDCPRVAASGCGDIEEASERRDIAEGAVDGAGDVGAAPIPCFDICALHGAEFIERAAQGFARLLGAAFGGAPPNFSAEHAFLDHSAQVAFAVDALEFFFTDFWNHQTARHFIGPCSKDERRGATLHHIAIEAFELILGGCGQRVI